MGWVEALRGSVVGLDTAPLIYYIEANPTYISMLDPFFDALDAGEFNVVTSFVTLLEVLVQPIRHGDTSLADQYRHILLNFAGLKSVPLSEDVAEQAAKLRAAHNLRTADAIQMATALSAGASVFLTNDLKLASVPGMQILTLKSLLTLP